MIITINQAQIEQAITDYVLSKMRIADDQRLDIDLRATRGAEGYTAVIEVVDADAPRAPSTRTEDAQPSIRETVRAVRATPALTRVDPNKPAIDATEAEEAEEASNEPDMSAEADAEEAAPEPAVETGPKPKSIFARHTKPTNVSADEAETAEA